MTVFPDDVWNKKCRKLNGFKITRANDFGIYYQGEGSLKVSDSLFVDSGLGIFSMVMRPPATSHRKEDKVNSLYSLFTLYFAIFI